MSNDPTKRPAPTGSPAPTEGPQHEPTPPALNWGTRWLDLVEASPAFDEQALRRGADYVSFDWQLDVEIDKGVASTVASSGPRMSYEASITVPQLTPDQVDHIVTTIASETQQIAAVLDGELPPDLDIVLDIDPAAIVPTCTCTSVDRPCKHASAVAHLIADAIADDPFDLLHLRGLSRVELIERLTEIRRGVGDDVQEPPDDAPQPPEANDTEPQLVWSAGGAALPRDLPPPKTAGALPPFPTPPPPGASFDEAGLRMLADDGARRAFSLITSGTSDWLELDSTTDLARRAADLEDSDEWKALVDRAQVSSQELRARAHAWRVGGAPAVEAHIAPTETVVDTHDRERQHRRTHDGQWVVFAKQKGRWLAVALGDLPGLDPAPQAD